MRRRLRVLLASAVLVGVVGAGAAAALVGQDDGAEARVEALDVSAPPFELRGDGDAAALVPARANGFTAAQAIVPSLAAYPVPAPPPGTEPVVVASNPTHEGFPLTLSVIETSPDGAWLHVRLPQRPNGLTGWVKAEEVGTWQVPNRIEVTLADHRLRVYEGDSDVVLYDTDVATGRSNTPTPVGDFFIDIVNPLGSHPVYGWGQLSVAGFSEVLERFAGGIGQIAIHGWNDDSVMGSASSNGCVRMRNGDIARVAELAPLGTPVRVVAA